MLRDNVWAGVPNGRYLRKGWPKIKIIHGQHFKNAPNMNHEPCQSKCIPYLDNGGWTKPGRRRSPHTWAKLSPRSTCGHSSPRFVIHLVRLELSLFPPPTPSDPTMQQPLLEVHMFKNLLRRTAWSIEWVKSELECVLVADQDKVDLSSEFVAWVR